MHERLRGKLGNCNDNAFRLRKVPTHAAAWRGFSSHAPVCLRTLSAAQTWRWYGPPCFCSCSSGMTHRRRATLELRTSGGTPAQYLHAAVPLMQACRVSPWPADRACATRSPHRVMTEAFGMQLDDDSLFALFFKVRTQPSKAHACNKTPCAGVPATWLSAHQPARAYSTTQRPRGSCSTTWSCESCWIPTRTPCMPGPRCGTGGLQVVPRRGRLRRFDRPTGLLGCHSNLLADQSAPLACRPARHRPESGSWGGGEGQGTPCGSNGAARRPLRLGGS
jgi:hypothetical protein